ncbi:MAG: hypothetical protein R2882_01460 [Gemmatimonadales bacterium]
MARELLQVARRSGGLIAMANWTPRELHRDDAADSRGAAPPPAGAPSPLAWGDRPVAERLGGGVSVLECSPRSIAFRYPMPPREVVRLFAGPTGRRS